MTIPNLSPAVSAFHPLFIPSRHVLPTTRLVDYRFNSYCVFVFCQKIFSKKGHEPSFKSLYYTYISRLTLGFDLFILFFNSIEPFRQSVKDRAEFIGDLNAKIVSAEGLKDGASSRENLFSNLRV